MKNTFIQNTCRRPAVRAVAAVSLLTIAVVWAEQPLGPIPVQCSNPVDNSQNTCTSVHGCQGTVYDYQGNGTLICTLTNITCGPSGVGSQNCQNYSYFILSYPYVNLTYSCSSGSQTNPCIPQYQSCNWVAVSNVTLTPNPDCLQQ